MGWFQLAIAIFGFSKELFKYLREQEESNKQCALIVKDTKNEIKVARKSKDTSGLESAFAGLALRVADKPAVKL